MGSIVKSNTESNVLAQEKILVYTAKCFADVACKSWTMKSPALLTWSAAAVCKLMQQVGNDTRTTKPFVLRFLLAWASHHNGIHGADVRTDRTGSTLLD